MSLKKKLRNFLNEAFSSGIIDKDVKEKLENFAEGYEPKSYGSFFNLITIFGGVMFSLGVILIISHNWNEISDVVKISAYLALLSAFHISAYTTQKSYPKLSQTIYFIISIYILAGIGLVSQIFNLSSKNGKEFLTWSILILPMAFLLSSKWIMTFSVMSLYYWISINDPIMNNVLGISNNAIGIIITNTTLHTSMVLLSKTFDRSGKLFGHVKTLGYIGLVVLIFVTCHLPLVQSSIFEKSQEIVLYPVTTGFIVFNVICLAFLFKRAFQLDKKILNIITMPESLILFINLIPITILFENSLVTSISYWLIWFCGGILMIYKGEKEASKSMINIGAWCIMIGLLDRFFNLAVSMLTGGSMFILSGIVTILIAFFGERYRKNLINKVFKTHANQK